MDDLYRMSPTEVAAGYVFGFEGPLPPPLHPDATPRQALEQVIGTALERTPCAVSFSGGRDSSLVLAIATHVARRDGHADPIPITKVFPGAPESDEAEWQETVIRHLGLADWTRIEIGDELDLVGPLAQEQLRRHGVLWPPTLHTEAPLQELIKHGSLLDGEGGDELLGSTFHRVAPVGRLIRSPRPVRWRVRQALGATAPRQLRLGRARRRWDAVATPWLRPAARESVVEALCADELAMPLAYSGSVRKMATRRSQRLLVRNRLALARERDVQIVSPLQHAEVVHAVGRHGGFLGPPDRTAALRQIAPDLLPDAVLARTSKAVFNKAYVTERTQEFAARWSGQGVDDALVDAEVLAEIWKAGDSSALTFALLQTAWLATNQ